MFGELFAFLRDTLQFIWPFRIVKEYERGALYEFGHFIRVLPPGCWLMLPWFTEIVPVSIAPKPVVTGRQDITLANGWTLSFDAAATMRVTDVEKSQNCIEDYHHSAGVLLSTMLAEELAKIEPARFEPSRRGRLFSSLNDKLQGKADLYGITMSDLTFTSFVLNARTYRLLIDKTDTTPVF